MAVPNNKLAPNLAKRGIADRAHGAAPTSTMSYFNMEHPVVGGYTPEKVALRRAVALAYDVRARDRAGARGQAIPAQSPMVPHTTGLRPGVQERDERVRPGARRRRCWTCTATSTAMATAGANCPTASRWCSSTPRQPEQVTASSTSCGTQGHERDRRAHRVSGSRKWPEQLKAARAGKLMMWGVGLVGRRPRRPDRPGAAATARQAARPTTRASTCRRFNALYEQQRVLPDGPERDA